MKIVIDMTDDLYKALMLGYEEPYSRAFGDCVRSGTLLPKGHGRLIDADDINNHIIGSVDTRDCPTIIEADKKGEQE